MGMGFWILLRHFALVLVLLMAPLGIYGAGKGNCSHLRDVSLSLVCNSVVPDYIFKLYRDNRAPANTPYSVWQAGTSGDDLIVLISFHDNFLHRFDAMRVEYFNPADMRHTFSMRSSKGFKTINVRPSLLHCFSISLRYPMELRNNCLGKGRSMEVAPNPILHYAMDDLRIGRKAGGAGLPNTCGFLLIVAVFCVFFFCDN